MATDPSRLSVAPPAFDAVLFDLDGTLVATERYWVPAARAGASRAFAELGIAPEMPSARGWMSLVGMPLEEGMRMLFPDLRPSELARVTARCVEEEIARLDAGEAALLPGVAATLERLAERGVALGIASNCGRDYLDHMLRELGLERWIDDARCLDSPGVSHKSGMIADLLLGFGTRSAVFVGDRASDRDAARANAIPCVRVVGTGGAFDEGFEAEAEIAGLDELEGVLARRVAWLERALAALGLAGEGARGTLGVTGRIASGKTLLARDLARLAGAEGRPVEVLAVGDFRRADGRDGAGDPLAAVDLEALGARLDRPRSGLRILEGPHLCDPRLRSRLDRVLHLDLPDDEILARVEARDVPLEGPRALDRLRAEVLPAERRVLALHPPSERADLVLDATDPLGGPPALMAGGRAD